MLTITEKIMNENQIKNKKVISSFTMWEKSPSSFQDRSMRRDELIDNLKNRYIYIKCEPNGYIETEKINKKWIQIASSSDDDKSEGKFYLIPQKTNEIYIKLSIGLIEMENFDKIHKNFIIKTVNTNQNKVVYYGLVVSIEIKEDNNIDIITYLHEIKTVDLIMNTISIAFISMLIYFILNLFQKKFNLLSIDYAFIVVIITYTVQLIHRTIYVKNTRINKFFWWIKYKFKKTKYNESCFTLKQFKKRIKIAHEKYEKTNTM